MCALVGGEDHPGALGDLLGLGDEERAALGRRDRHMLVVHDLVAHVHRWAVVLQARSTASIARSTPAQ